tara:strand:+ start:2265 stop:3827 length:1563 start_codon:yes stop_codon:yes gene_type:complete
MNTHEYEDYEETIDQEKYSLRETEDYGKSLPAVVEEFVEAAVKVSNNNHIPASIGFFTILGQVVKDFIHIPYGQGREDTRIHFCWIQTSGTGKSTLWNFIGPVSDRLFKKINANPASKAHPPLYTNSSEETVLDIMPRKFDTFGLTDYTDAVLIGGYTEERTEVEGEKPTFADQRNPGKLEGNGLAHWDEFEYSGIFNQSQHQEKAIVYLNTLMNSLAGESWVISKALMSYKNKTMECFCERSVFAMTYPPHNLNEVITSKGVMQRMLLYVKQTPKKTQHNMRLEQCELAGIVQEVEQPIDKHADAMFNIYTVIQERFNEVGGDPLKTVTYGPNFNAALKLAYLHMQEDLLGTRLEVDVIADNFTTRMIKTLTRMAVLCCVAQSPSINDKSKRFIVTGQNVEQAERVVRQCYKSLVAWLDQSIRRKKQGLKNAPFYTGFKSVFNDLVKQNKTERKGLVKNRISDEDRVHKTAFMKAVIEKMGSSKNTVYRQYNELLQHNVFDEKKEGRTVYVKMKKGDEK